MAQNGSKTNRKCAVNLSLDWTKGTSNYLKHIAASCFSCFFRFLLCFVLFFSFSAYTISWPVGCACTRAEYILYILFFILPYVSRFTLRRWMEKKKSFHLFRVAFPSVHFWCVLRLACEGLFAPTDAEFDCYRRDNIFKIRKSLDSMKVCFAGVAEKMLRF